MSKKVEVLEKAKALIADKSKWVQGNFTDTSTGVVRRCAVQAWRDALHEYRRGYMPDSCAAWSPSVLMCEKYGLTLLDKAASDLWDKDEIMVVNDELGWEAVMDVYDRAIKEARIEAEG